MPTRKEPDTYEKLIEQRDAARIAIIDAGVNAKPDDVERAARLGELAGVEEQRRVFETQAPRVYPGDPEAIKLQKKELDARIKELRGELWPAKSEPAPEPTPTE